MGNAFIHPGAHTDPSASLSIRPAALPSIRSHFANSSSFYMSSKIFKGSSPLSIDEIHGKHFVNNRVFHAYIMSSVFHVFTLQFLLKTKFRKDANRHCEK